MFTCPGINRIHILVNHGKRIPNFRIAFYIFHITIIICLDTDRNCIYILIKQRIQFSIQYRHLFKECLIQTFQYRWRLYFTAPFFIILHFFFQLFFAKRRYCHFLILLCIHPYHCGHICRIAAAADRLTRIFLNFCNCFF